MDRLAKGALAVFIVALAESECQEPDHPNLLQIGRGLDDAKSNPMDAMVSIIDTAFGDLAEKTHYRLPPPVESGLLDYQLWQECAHLDYTSFSGIESATAQELLKSIGITQLCQLNDPICKAFYAALEALQKLRKLNVKPKMQNYSLVNWAENEVGFPSWGSASQVDVDYSASPPTATTSDTSAGTGYAFCELVVTTMRQSNIQLFNSCGPSAVLSAMLMRSPIEAFKKGLQLYYTGTLPGLPEPPCSYIFNQQPGIMPFEDGQPGYETFPKGTHFCPGEMNQEEGVKQGTKGKPCQAIGIQKMWITTLLAAYDNKLRKDAGVPTCPEIYTAIYPAENEAVATHTKASHVTTPAFMKYASDVALADGTLGTYKYLSGGVAKCTAAAGLSTELCEKLAEGVGITSEGLGKLQKAYNDHKLEEIMVILAEPSNVGFVLAANGEESAAVTGMIASFTPTATGSALNLDEVCGTKNAMLFIFTNGLYEGGADAANVCDHWVTISTCGEDTVDTWTWGSIRRVSKAKLSSNLCGAVVQAV